MRDSAMAIWLSAALLLPGCSTRPEAISGAETFSGRGDHAVYVVSHGWHTGIVLPAKLLTADNPQLKARFGEVEFLEVGWGDEAFYQAEEITFANAARAALWVSIMPSRVSWRRSTAVLWVISSITLKTPMTVRKMSGMVTRRNFPRIV